MKLVKTPIQLMQNIERIENYLISGNDEEKAETIKLIKRGTCFIAYTIENELRFAPSRFLGYINNTISKHKKNENKHGGVTNDAIIAILESEPYVNQKLEKEYLIYCKKLGIIPSKTGAFGARRKFWQLKLKGDFQENIETEGEFPEGKVIERMHKSRERNSRAVKIAKENFIKIHKKLFCQVCDFDFEDKYGRLGKNFIEGHHIIPISEMAPDHKTRPQDIVMLCSNCHRMIHKKRPWLTITNLSSILKK
jgi:5-methylcytosine-specific restriction protein A